MRAAVFDYRGDDPPPTARETLPVAVAINDLAIPNVRTEIIRPNVIPNAQFGDVRFDALEERLVELLERSRIARSVQRSRHLSREGIPGPGFVVQFRIQSYGASSSLDPGGMAAAVLAGVPTVGLGSLSLVGVTLRHEHHFQVEVRLYRVEDSRLVSVRAPRSGELVAQYDTAGAQLVWRTAAQLSFRSGHCQSCRPSGAEAEVFHRREGRQMARLIFDRTAAALFVQMRNSLAAQPPSPAQPLSEGEHEEAPQSTAGGEALPDFGALVRARLDQTATRILLCTASEASAIVVEWAGPGPVVVTVRDASEDAVGCVRAAIGDLTAPTGTPPGRILHVVSR